MALLSAKQTMQELSPFSLLNRYKVITINDYLVEPKFLTPREIVLLNILKSCGTAAGFQLEGLWTNKEGRRKLKKLARQKIIIRHKLDGKPQTQRVLNKSYF
ncbi:MAG: hypothetical protein VR67_14585 [Peptococcaceae bacterium BRH_c8a]|nr:MAG: hypothetical protein VR67_14585 [Peptococcaceae bacterium BRH_c8a]